MIDPTLKQRLVGAAVLVALAIIFVPMLVSKRPLTEEVLPPPAPPPSDDIFAEEILPIEPEAMPAEPPAADLPEAERPAAGAPAVAEDELPALTALPEAERPASLVGDARAWVVQVASFAEKANAEKLAERLRGAGYHAYLDTVDQDGKPMHRVRVGPDIVKAAAARTRDEVAAMTGLEPIVMRHP